MHNIGEIILKQVLLRLDYTFSTYMILNFTDALSSLDRDKVR